MNSLRANINSSEFSGHASQAGKLEYGEFLFNGFTQLFDVQPVLADIHRAFGNDQKLRILCYQLSEYPSLMAAFKASSNNDNTFLQRALFCSWFSFLIAGQLKLPVSTTKDLFIAGLIQGIASSGGQHLKALSPIFSDDAGSLNADDKGPACSVILGRFLDTVPRLSEGVKAIVSSNHDKFDIAATSDGNVESQLFIAQQILIVSNEMSELGHPTSDTSYDFAAILPILKLNSAVYFRSVYYAVIKIVTPSRISKVEHQAASINAILDIQNKLVSRWPHLLKASAELTLLNDSDSINALKHMARRAWMLVTTSGILSGDISTWLSQLNNSEQSTLSITALEVLSELDVLLNELSRIILSYQLKLEAVTKDLNVEMSESKRSLLTDLCYSMGEEQETFDLDEFTILNMCD